MAFELFGFFSVVNSVAMNVCVQVFIWMPVSIILSIYLGVEMLD